MVRLCSHDGNALYRSSLAENLLRGFMQKRHMMRVRVPDPSVAIACTTTLIPKSAYVDKLSILGLGTWITYDIAQC